VSHPDDVMPYRSRESLFETIRLQRIELDQKDDAIRKRDEEIDKLRQGYEHIEGGAGWENPS